ncbi:MAG: tRNA (guanosine(37)-N1)-methyltransferase TrmD [Myxococcota bacterium]
MSRGPRIDIVTIFPELVEHFLSGSLLGAARREGTVDVRVTDLRSFATDRHHSVDDSPYGGGDGMVLCCEPVVAAVEAIAEPGARVLALCPRGRRFAQPLARELAGERQIVLLAGRYAGFDDRIFALTGAEPLSIGDYVLAGGELAALVVAEAVTRLIAGVVGNPISAQADSFSAGALEHPLFTRPREFRGLSVPDVLLSGDHAEIARWRESEAERVTRERRPDLLVSNGVKR